MLRQRVKELLHTLRPFHSRLPATTTTNTTPVTGVLQKLSLQSNRRARQVQQDLLTIEESHADLKALVHGLPPDDSSEEARWLQKEKEQLEIQTEEVIDAFIHDGLVQMLDETGEEDFLRSDFSATGALLESK